MILGFIGGDFRGLEPKIKHVLRISHGKNTKNTSTPIPAEDILLRLYAPAYPTCKKNDTYLTTKDLGT